MTPFRRWVAWCLVFALPICSASSTLAAMLGARHFHAATTARAPATSGTAVLADFRRSGEVALAPTTPHVHSWLARHHHDAADDSVMALDAATGDANASSSGGSASDGAVVLVLAWLARIAPWPVYAMAGAWPVADASPLHSVDSQRAERPPRT